MAELLGYHNSLWKPIMEFTHKGEPEEFTLQPGKYLLVCSGAKGGSSYRYSNMKSYGGVSYGILNLKEPSAFYAVVGGDGEDYTPKNTSTSAKGGYNGGGDGGLGYAGYENGPGGGGASDIRLTLNDEIVYPSGTARLPDEYQEVEYIECDYGSYINTGYIHKSNTTVEWIGEAVTQLKTTEILFGSRKSYGYNQLWFQSTNGSTNSAAYGCGTTDEHINNFPFNKKVKIVANGSTCSWYVGDNLDEFGSSITVNSSMQDGVCPLFLFSMADNSTVPNSKYNAAGKLYSFKIFEDGELVHDFVPCYTQANPEVVGLYDIFANEFVEASGKFNIKKFPTKSLLSRIIVAGGGGGFQSTDYINYSANGGGAFGGCIISGSKDPNNYKYPTQTDGYSFGQGMTPNKKTNKPNYGAEGAGGGGGGWFGGYSSGSDNCEYSSCNGGGGSGYVYTEASYKPYEGTDIISPDYYLTDTTLTCGQSVESSIKIYIRTIAPNVGDTIEFPNVCRTEEIGLFSGTYEIECYGGDGGIRSDINRAARGGYVRGTLNNTKYRKIFVTVGGSGISGGISPPFPDNYNPSMSFNGGGNPGVMNDYRSCAGGGASDVRLDVNDLYHRIIVAGGGGAQGSSSDYGGAGGGETGEAATGRYGTTPGPGTQSGTPQNTTYPTVNGSFGKGGNGVCASGGFGGAGGGGWFGGSGTYPDGSGDDDRGGCGGSGYVYNELSYKPDEYEINDPADYLSDTYMLTGGNSLPQGMSKIVITCNDIQSIRFLAYDNEGYKFFNNETNSWEYFYATELTPEIFEEYGALNATTDQGLLNEYTIYAYNDINYTDKISIYVSPYKQLRIKAYTGTNMMADKLSIDADYNEDLCQINTIGRRVGTGDDAKLMIDMYVNNKPRGEIIDIYCVHTLSVTRSVSKANRYIKPVDPNHKYEPESGSGVLSYESGIDYSTGSRVMDPDTGREYDVIASYTSKSIKEDLRENYIKPKKKYLLKVGSSSDKQLSYRNFLGTYGDETIDTIYCRLSAINRRTLYLLMDCVSSSGTKFVRIKAVNMITSKTRLIADLPWDSLGSDYHGGFLVDDNYGYVSHSEQVGSSNGYRRIFRFSLTNPADIKLFQFAVNERRYRFESFGKMVWKDKNTIMLDTYNGCVEFNTITRLFTEHYYSTKSNNRRDFCVGKRYFISNINANSTSSYVYDMIDDLWYDLANTFFTLPVNAPSATTYDDDNSQFIFVQTGYITFVDEETMTIVKSVPTSWGVPKSVHYTNGYVFITINDSPLMWIFDIKNNRFDGFYLDWSMGGLSETTITRPSVFKGYFFQPYWTLLVFTFQGAAKYNFGGKYSQYQILYNKASITNLSYDENFVTVYDDFVEVHDGSIQKETVEDSVGDGYQITHASFNKNEYSEFINLRANTVPIDEPVVE